MDRAPLSSPRPSPAAAGCLIAFFSVFALIGAVSFYAATVRPALALLATRSWRQLPPNLLVGLVPLVFFAIGVAGIAWVLHGGARPKLAASPAFGAVDPQAGRGGSIELRPQMTRVGALIFLAFFCVLWNGIVSVFVWQAVQGWRNGARDGCMTVFLLPFVAIGLLVVFLFLRQVLILFNPKVHLLLTPAELTLGESAWLQWQLGGRGGGVRRLLIRLGGREEATRQAGK